MNLKITNKFSWRNLKTVVLVLTLCGTMTPCSGQKEFRKDEFLRNCGFSVEGNKLSDQEEYDIIYSGVYRGEKTQRLYELFNQTRDYETNLEICRKLSLGLSMRNFTGSRGTDSLLIDNFFARAIERTEDKGVLVRLMLGYANDKTYSEQGAIGEECLKPECFVNDSLKNIALEYAIEGNWEKEEPDLKRLCELWKDKMATTTRAFGKDSRQAYDSLLGYAQITQYANEADTVAVDSLIRYHLEECVTYKEDGISDIYVDPLYMRYITCLKTHNISYAVDILKILAESTFQQKEDQYSYEWKAEAKLVVIYETARLFYAIKDPECSKWIKEAMDQSLAYLSPTGGFTQLKDYIKPDFNFLQSVVNLMPLAYNSSSVKEAYNTALFIKGTSSLITSTLIKTIKESGVPELVEYVDSLRLNYNPHPFRSLPIEAFNNPEVQASLEREQNFSDLLNETVSKIPSDELWKNCNVTCDDVYQSLKAGETAVEIVRPLTFVNEEECYHALILNHGDPEPKKVRLCPCDKVNEYIHQRNPYYGKSHELYDLLVAPMVPFIKGKEVYYSPAGLLSIVNISALSNGKGRIVADRWNIHNCSSTKSLCDRDSKPLESIVLFGAMSYEKNDVTPHFSEQGEVLRDVEREGFGYLKATLGEVLVINSLAEAKGIWSSYYTGEAGTEKAFRALTGKDVSIIHLATHGFYYNSERAKQGDFALKGDSGMALNRCGIVFSDCMEAWKNGIDPYDDDNGIMLGSEIASMDLTGTDLVVLSACNTGIGDITNEGISGLQQAFKKAGVKSLLMSLKPIDDEATEVFMTEFYRHLFNGRSKKESFDRAVKRLKSIPKYSKPGYWASYILLD